MHPRRKENGWHPIRKLDAILFAVSSDISLWIPVNLFILRGLLKLHSWLHNITIKCIPNCHSAFLTCKHSRCMSVILIQGLWFTKHAWLAKTWSEDLSGGKCLVNMKTLCWGFQLQFGQGTLQILSWFCVVWFILLIFHFSLLLIVFLLSC